jgi:two-component system, chemotaxis family, CheB/CheR fusion protein
MDIFKLVGLTATRERRSTTFCAMGAAEISEWREQGGPPVKPSARKGFGRFVTEQMVTRALNATVKTDFGSEGLRWTLQMPASEARGF